MYLPKELKYKDEVFNTATTIEEAVVLLLNKLKVVVPITIKRDLVKELRKKSIAHSYSDNFAQVVAFRLVKI